MRVFDEVQAHNWPITSQMYNPMPYAAPWDVLIICELMLSKNLTSLISLSID